MIFTTESFHSETKQNDAPAHKLSRNSEKKIEKIKKWEEKDRVDNL